MSAATDNGAAVVLKETIHTLRAAHVEIDEWIDAVASLTCDVATWREIALTLVGLLGDAQRGLERQRAVNRQQSDVIREFITTAGGSPTTTRRAA